MSARIEMLLRENEPPLAGLTAGVQDALSRLARTGATEDEVERDVIATDGAAGLPMLYFALGALARRGALSYRITSDAGTLATATVRAPLTLADAGAARRLSRFAILRRDGDAMIVETPLSNARVAIEDPRVLSLVATLGAPNDERSATLSRDEADALCTLFSACGLLAADDEDEGALAYWSVPDLLFHARSRAGRHRGVVGASFRFRGRTEPPPVVKPQMSDEVVELDTPELRGEFASVVERRHSSRHFGATPITRRELGELLYRTARVREVFDVGSGQQLSRRPYPGGGAVYELEIYATVRDCADLRPGFYHYGPREHRLARIGDVREPLIAYATQPDFPPPQVLLTIAARFGRVFWKYESMGYALILKDVGALMQTLYLTAEAMGLAACALGAGDSDVFAAAAGLDYYEETSVGEFMIGSKAENGAP